MPALKAVAEFVARFAVLLLGQYFALGQRRVARIDDDVGGEVDDLLELARRHVEQDADARGHALEIPNVADGRGELDVAHALAAHFGARDLDAAAVADHAFEADALVLAAVAFPVFGRSEDLLAEQPVALGFERAVVDRFGLLDFAERPSANLFGAGEADAHRVEIVDVEKIHSVLMPGLADRSDGQNTIRARRPSLPEIHLFAARHRQVLYRVLASASSCSAGMLVAPCRSRTADLRPGAVTRTCLHWVPLAPKAARIDQAKSRLSPDCRSPKDPDLFRCGTRRHHGVQAHRAARYRHVESLLDASR